MISDIRLQNFRSYQDQNFGFSSGVNVIVGPNGSGKTNLLEAIQVVSNGSSFRVDDTDLISFTKDWFRLDAEIDGVSRTLKYSTNPKQTKIYEISDKITKNLDYKDHIPLVLFEPNHLAMLHGTPDSRRDYLDAILEQTVSGYTAHKKQYKRVLSQRNALLKRGKVAPGEIFPWNLRLSELGSVIAKERNDLVKEINKTLPGLYMALSRGSKNVDIIYRLQFPVEVYESQFMFKLESSIVLDSLRGFTTAGPHREDFTVMFDGRTASDVASRGEIRTAVLALKIIELEILDKKRGVAPILLLDDVFSELDSKRRESLTDYLQKYQTFITTTDADSVNTLSTKPIILT